MGDSSADDFSGRFQYAFWLVNPYIGKGQYDRRVEIDGGAELFYSQDISVSIGFFGSSRNVLGQCGGIVALPVAKDVRCSGVGR